MYCREGPDLRAWIGAAESSQYGGSDALPGVMGTGASRVSFVFERVKYSELNARQQESFNFQKVSAVLADYGFVTILLASDWQGADFIAQHRDGTFLMVQLKGRLSFAKKYEGRDLYVCFRNGRDWFMYPHDVLLAQVLEQTSMGASASWRQHGGYSFPVLSKTMLNFLEPYRL